MKIVSIFHFSATNMIKNKLTVTSCCCHLNWLWQFLTDMLLREHAIKWWSDISPVRTNVSALPRETLALEIRFFQSCCIWKRHFFGLLYIEHWSTKLLQKAADYWVGRPSYWQLQMMQCTHIDLVDKLVLHKNDLARFAICILYLIIRPYCLHKIIKIGWWVSMI